jgi:hypothetical protein
MGCDQVCPTSSKGRKVRTRNSGRGESRVATRETACGRPYPPHGTEPRRGVCRAGVQRCGVCRAGAAQRGSRGCHRYCRRHGLRHCHCHRHRLRRRHHTVADGYARSEGVGALVVHRGMSATVLLPGTLVAVCARMVCAAHAADERSHLHMRPVKYRTPVLVYNGARVQQ